IILSKSENPKPEAPPSLDIDKIKAEIEENFRSSRRIPGEPILDFEVKNCPDTLTLTKLCPASEKRRRNIVNKTKIWLKIKVNNKLVTEVPPVKFNDQFIMSILTPLLVEVVSWPYEIKIEVFEGLVPFRQELKASILLPIPDIQNTEENDQPFDVVDFSSEQANII
ncbi:Coiled-coil and C2 domain-containing protein 2A, partial [Armadillidium vulgare]